MSPRRMGNAHPNLVPYQVFEAADGPLIVATGNDRQARDFCRIVGRADLADDPRYASNADRIRRRAEYIAALVRGDGAGCAAPTCSPRWRRRTCRPGRSTPSPRPSPTRRRSRAGMRVELPATGVRGDVAPAVRSPMLIDGEAAHGRARRAAAGGAYGGGAGGAGLRRGGAGAAAGGGGDGVRNGEQGSERMIIVTGDLVASATAFEELRRISLEHVHRSRAEPGCLHHSVQVDCEIPCALCLSSFGPTQPR